MKVTIVEVSPDENKLTGFVFKIQANMDPKHHDRLAFMRIVSGEYIERNESPSSIHW